MNLIDKITEPSVKFTEESLSEWQGGVCRSYLFVPKSFIVIRPKYKDTDIGILMHELKHAEQHKRYWTMKPLIKLVLGWRFTLKIELEAYKTQVSYYPVGTDISWIATSFVNKYGFKMTIEEASLVVADQIQPYVGTNHNIRG